MVSSTSRRSASAPALSYAYLYNAAIRYLQRFSSSSENLRRILQDKVRRASEAPDQEPSQAETWIEEILQKLQEARYLNDQEYARLQVLSLHQRGLSAMMIRGKLREKGVPSDLITDALDGLQSPDAEDEDGPSPDLLAACIFARKKKLGPWRRSLEERQARRDRDLAALRRAGFSFQIARQILDASAIDELPSSSRF